jgi:hypothetical protein
MNHRRSLSALKLAVIALALTAGLRSWPADAPATIIPAPRARAKAVIQIWLAGGPSHLDTFDPKPGAGNDYCGPLSSPIQTNVPAIEISQLLPLLAQQADKYSLIRSMTHGDNGHETAAYVMQTGHVPSDDVVYPSLGVLVSYFKGYAQGYNSPIPPYVILTESLGRFNETGFLGPRYKPFVTGGNPNQPVFAAEGIFTLGISDQRQRRRSDLLHALDSLGKAMPGSPAFELFDRSGQNAEATLAGARKLFDLSQETPALRDRYGRTPFGQSCLMARRLVENGVPYVTVNYGGWDDHDRIFEKLRLRLPDFDKGLSALLQDLSGRGLLDSTIVWCCGEFGRTPKIDWQPPWNGGRNHWGDCFSVLVAGGGFKGGCVVGASDAKGEHPAERPVYPPDLLGSICELLGIDPDAPLPNPRELKLQVMPPWTDRGDLGRLKEIMN